MAIYRQIHTQIWKDGWFLDLSPEEKLLFIYLFSNERTSVAGIYDISIKVIAFETDLDGKIIKAAFEKFAKAGKVFYEDGIVWVKNLRKYNATNSIKVLERIRRDIEALPDCPIKKRYIAEEDIPYIPKKKPVYLPQEPKRDNRVPGSRGAQQSVRNRLVKERGEVCESCGDGPPIELHHIVPVRADGSLDDDNCLLLCVPCHKEADVKSRQEYPISESQIPYFENGNEQEQEKEREQEQDFTESPSGDAPDQQKPTEKGNGIPENFQGWSLLIQESSNRPATLVFMHKTLFPGSDPPAFGYIGKVARKVGGAGRLAELLWQASTRPPTGDVLAYVQAVAKGKAGRDPPGGAAEPKGFAGVREFMERHADDG